MCPEQDKKYKQIKIQGVYRKIKKQEREDKLDIDKEKNNNNIGAFIAYFFVFLWIILLILNAIFDL